MNDVVNTNLKDGNAPEIVLTYDVSSHRTLQDVAVKLYAFDCSTPAQAVKFSTNLLQKNNNADQQTLELKIDIDEKKIMDSNIWKTTTQTDDSEGNIELCVRVDLWERTLTPPESVSMVRTHLTTNVKLGGSFGFSMGATKVIDEVDVSNAVVEYDVKACICDGNLYHCDPNPAPAIPNSMLTLCVWCESPEVELYEIVKFYLEQEQDLVTYQYKAIHDSKTNAVTNLELKHENIEGDWCVVRTPFPTSLFDHQKSKAANVQGIGQVLLRFVSDNRRERHLVRARLMVAEKESAVYGDFKVQDIELADISGATVVVGMFVTTIMGVAALFCIMVNI
jgi:hypothetical protein